MTNSEDLSIDFIEEIQEASEEFKEDLRMRRKEVKLELVHLTYNVDRLREIYHKSFESLIRLKKSYESLDRQLADIDGRKVIIKIKPKKKKIKVVNKHISDEMALLPKEVLLDMAHQLKCFLDNTCPMDISEPPMVKQADEEGEEELENCLDEDGEKEV
jgi:hypothetical protein